jgi:hypothetical protein
MPTAKQSPISRMTALFLDLDGGEMENVIDSFKAIHRRRTARLPSKDRPATALATSTAPVKKSHHKKKPATPATLTEAAGQ